MANPSALLARLAAKAGRGLVRQGLLLVTQILIFPVLEAEAAAVLLRHLLLLLPEVLVAPRQELPLRTAEA
jgi:hypothetical protein